MTPNARMIVKQTMLCQALMWGMMSAWANEQKPQAISENTPSPSSSPQEIEAKLAAFYQKIQTTPQETITPTDTPVARLGSGAVPLGLDVEAVTRLPTLQSVSEQETELNPDAYLPAYQYQETVQETDDTQIDEVPTISPIKRLYNHLFHDGVEQVARLDVQFFDGQGNLQKNTDVATLPKLSKKQRKQEPYANIEATLEDMSLQSVADFRASMPRLRQAVRTAARAVGYYDVEFSLTKAKAGEINVIIHRLGEPVKVEHQTLEVRGDGANDPDYIKVVQEPPLKQGDVFHHGNYEATKSAITAISGEKGYFDSKWLNSSADVILPDNIADVNLTYETGQQYHFDDVVFFTFDPETKSLTTDPDKLPVKPKLLKQLMTFQMGDAYNRSAIQNLSNSLLATGYFNAVNTEMVLPDPSRQEKDEQGVNFENTAQDSQKETITLDDGTTADIAPIEFSPSQVLSEKLALVAQKAERLYNAPDDRLLITDTRKESRSILGRISDAISSVAQMILPDESKDVLPALSGEPLKLQGRKTPQAAHQDKKVPLYVFVMSDRPRDAQVGMGWGSDSGARLITKFEHNLLNKDGLQAGVDVRLSEDKKGVLSYLTKPMSHPLNDTLRATLLFETEQLNQGTGSFDLHSKTLETGLSRNIINQQGWNRTYSVRYHLDELETHAPRSVWGDLPIQFLNGTPTQEALLAGYAMHKMKADNLISPMTGFYQHYSLEAGVGGLLTDTNMAIFRTKLGGMYSFGDNDYGKNRAHQLIGSIQGGYLWADDFNAVPYKLRFFAGGDQSIRGYNYQSLSPLSDKGYLTGGQTLVVASGEYNYEVLEDVRLGVFADVGNAYDKSFSNDTKIGAGVGVRWASPVGQVRIDVATAVDEPDHPIKLHFFIGLPF